MRVLVAIEEVDGRKGSIHWRGSVNRILASMKASRAHWLACVSVEHSDQKRGDEIGTLTADLALTGLAVGNRA
jgi:hypothetical protein